MKARNYLKYWKEYIGIIDEVYMDKKEVLAIKNKVEKLAYGIDPSTNKKYSNDTSINNWDNKILFKDIIKILDEIIDNKLVSSDKRKKQPFLLKDEQISKIELSTIPISISSFVHSINSTCVLDNMKKLKATDVTSWLEKQGYLSEINYYEGCCFRKLTDKSEEINLSIEKKKNKYGNYYNVILYSYESQKYIVDHLSEISDYIRNK